MVDGRFYGFICANAPVLLAAMLSTVMSPNDPMERWRMVRGTEATEVRKKINGMLKEFARE